MSPYTLASGHSAIQIERHARVLPRQVSSIGENGVDYGWGFQEGVHTITTPGVSRLLFYDVLMSLAKNLIYRISL